MAKKSKLQSRKMSDTTTYMTDFMEQVLKEEYDRHVDDTTPHDFFNQFCFADSAFDEEPNWSHQKTNDWIKNTLESLGGYDDLPQMMQHAIYRDIDTEHLVDWLTKEHKWWWASLAPEQGGEEEEEDDVKDPIEPVPALPPRDCRVDDPC